MFFALAKTQGDRPTTITTAAMSDNSPRTSAVPAPSVFLPHAEPSTSQGVGAARADTSTAPDADGNTNGADSVGESQVKTDDDDSMSSEEEYVKSGSTFTIAFGSYFFERNLIETLSSSLVASKPVIEYANLKFIENSFKTSGNVQSFDRNCIMRAELEFESFEIWFSHVKEYAPDREFIKDLRVPLFSHLYLDLYKPVNHTHLQELLHKFRYLFSSPIGSIYLDELKNVTNVLKLSPRLAYFRKHKFVYGVSPGFIRNLYNFFNLNYMLQKVFQEWVDINYSSSEDPIKVFDDYFNNKLVRVNNLVKANAPKVNNNVNISRAELCKKIPNSSQNENNSSKINNTENDYFNNQRPSTSRDFAGSSHQESNSRKLSNNPAEDLQRKVTNSESDESTENSEQSSTEDHFLKPRSRQSKKNNIKRKHLKYARDRPSSYERESRKIKKFCVAKDDDTSLQKRSISHQENGKLSEESLREGQSSSMQEEVKEERIILRISRKFNRLHVIGSNEKKEPNDPENDVQEKSNEEQISNDKKKSRKHRRKHKSRHTNKYTTDNNIYLHERSNEISDNEQLRKKIKSSNRKNSTGDQDSFLCEESSEISDDDDKEKRFRRQKKSKRSKSTNNDNNMQMGESLFEVSNNDGKKTERQKKSGRRKSANDDNTQMNESLSKVSNEENNVYRRQKKSGESKSVSDDNMHMSGLSDVSDISNNENKQKGQNKRSKTKTTIDDNYHTFSEISSDEQKFQKSQKKKKLKGKQKSDRNIKNDSSLCGSSSEDSLEDSSSLSSSCDEEVAMRTFMKYSDKSPQRVRYEAKYSLKHINTTKIDLRDIHNDVNLRLSRKIILKNCSKLSCSILTFDQNLVVAGSIDSLIYLWERKNDESSEEENNLVEYLDINKAFILRGHGGPIFDLAELPSAKILLSASNDKTYRAWDMVSKRCLEVYNEHEHKTWCIAACPYSLQVATGSSEGTCCLWFLNYKHPLRFFTGHLDDILVVKFHPNQVLIATGSSDKTIRVFELTTGDCHRLLTGHSDYITCLEFNAQNPNYLASASACGEIVVWDIPTAGKVWKIKVNNSLFSDLVWLTEDLLLAPMTNGVVLKCDTTLNYEDSSCKVKGFETQYDRLISLQIIDNIVYTIGIPDKSGCLKPLSKRSREKDSQIKSEQQKSQKEPSLLSKLFFPEQIIDNNGSSMIPLRGLGSTIPSTNCNFDYQINIDDQLKKSTFPNFFDLNLSSAPFNLTADEISKLSFQYQSENIRLIPAVSINNNLQNAYILPVQQNIRTSNLNSTNVQLPSTSKSQKLNKTQGPSKTKTTVKQNNFGNSSLTMHSSIQHMQIKTTTVQEQLHLDDHRETNMSVQQYLQTTSTSTHKQQTTNLLQYVARPGVSSQLIQNSIVQQEQQVQLQNDVGSNSNSSGTNVQQQQLLQQLQPNKNLTKGNVQQRLSPQTNNRSSNINVTKRPSPRHGPNKLSSLD